MLHIDQLDANELSELLQCKLTIRANQKQITRLRDRGRKRAKAKEASAHG